MTTNPPAQQIKDSPTKLRSKTQPEAFRLSRTALIYLAAIGLAEAITNLYEAPIGLGLHAAILWLLLVQAAWAEKRVRRGLLLALTLAPLTRVVSLAMPLPRFPPVYRHAVAGAPLFVAVYLAARACGLQGGMLGLNVRRLFNRRRLAPQVLVGLSGVPLGYVEYRLLGSGSPVGDLRESSMWLQALILLVFSGLLEELIYRGLVQYNAVRALGVGGIYYAAGLGAVMSMGYRSPANTLFVFVVGVYFGWVVQRSGSLVGAALAHGLVNIVVLLVMPSLVG
jgi:membrane protease YdiL (CAAX protease family)